MVGNSRRDKLFVILAGIFITNAVVAELIGGKLILIGSFKLSIGILPWPIVFLTTDIINEYFGEKGVKRLSILTAILIAYAFVVLFGAIQVPAASFSPVSDSQFTAVFAQSQLIIVGSIIAFLVGQVVDVTIFWLLRKRTGKGFLWLRATGSTIVSQLIDSFIVLGIAFYLPGKITGSEFVEVGFTNYTFKLGIAVALTPLIYLTHWVIDNYLGKDDAEKLIEHTAHQTLGKN